MSWIVIPTFQDSPRYTITVPLDGVGYVFTFDWHDRERRWFLDLARETGEEVLRGAKVVANWNLLRKVSTRFRPPQILFASARDGAPPLLHDFGTRVLLLYGRPDA
jgi:hypothetical protein